VEIPEIALDPKETFDSTNTHGITGGPVTGWKAITNGTSMGGTNSGSLKNRVSNSKEYIGDVLFTEWEELNNRSHYTKKRKEEKTSPIYIKSSFKDHDPERKYYSEEDYSPEYIMIMLFGLLVIVITIIVIIAANL
jgi:hypothetical protein